MYSRIRNNDKIIGYIRHDLTHPFFTRDFFWWSGELPAFDTEDAYAQVQDRKGRRLFVHDIVTVHFRSRLRRSQPFRIANRDGCFYLLHLKSNRRYPIDSAEVASLEFLSYTFINTALVYGGFPQ